MHLNGEIRYTQFMTAVYLVLIDRVDGQHGARDCSEFVCQKRSKL